MTEYKELKGTIFDIQRFCLHDGPGIRTTVFLKGCNLRCKWCHNPESFVMGKQLSYNAGKCTLCCECIKVCPNNVHEITDGVHILRFGNCKLCGLCTEGCLAEALRIIGREVTVGEVVKEALKDKKYYEESGGGVTISGGECTVQFDFLLELLKELKKFGINTCIETNGIIKEERLKTLTGLTDLFLVDFKLADPELHRLYTGGDNSRVYYSLKILDGFVKPVILRCPIIPGVNDSNENFMEIARICREHNCIRHVELMPYHKIGRDKWQQTGNEYEFKDLETVSSSQVEEWKDILRGYGCKVL